MLKKELAIRVVFQPKFNRLSVISFKDDEDSRKKVKDTFKSHEVCINILLANVSISLICILILI